MVCSRSRSGGGLWGLVLVVGCGAADVGLTSGSSSGTTSGAESSSSTGRAPEPGSSGPGVATSTDPAADGSGSGDATSVGGGTTDETTGPALTTEDASTGTGSPGSEESDGSSGETSGETGAVCQPEPVDACSGCVADRCVDEYCACEGVGACLCVLGCLDADSLGALLGCVVGDCGLPDVGLDNLTSVVGISLSPLQGCEALTAEGPDSCAGVCPALAYLQ